MMASSCFEPAPEMSFSILTSSTLAASFAARRQTVETIPRDLFCTILENVF